MSRYEEFEAFVRTIEAGSFTAAAEQLRVAKSAISRRISDLEQRLGAQLIVRSTRKLVLTDAGDTLFLQAKQLLEDWREAESATRDNQGQLAGTIRIASPLSFGIAHLSPALLAFQAEHPDVNFDIDFSDRQVDLITDGFDLAIRIGQLTDSSNIARKLAPVRMIAAASKDYVRENGIPETPSDLLAMTELRYTHRPLISWTFTDNRGKSETITMQATMHATSGEFLRDAAIEGCGVTIQPNFILYEALKESQLIQLLPDHSLPELGIYAVYPASRHLPQRVRALIDALALHCGDTPYWDAF